MLRCRHAEDREVEEIFDGADGSVMNGEDANYTSCREFSINASALVYRSGWTEDVKAKETESTEEMDVLIPNFEHDLMKNYETAGCTSINRKLARLSCLTVVGTRLITLAASPCSLSRINLRKSAFSKTTVRTCSIHV